MTEGVVGNLFVQSLHEKWALGSWSNQAHVSFQYVEHLWNLIDSQFANDFSHSRHPRIILCRPNRTNISFRTLRHRANFIYGKWLVVLSYSLLTIKYGTGTIQLDRYCRE